jgi:hypothetical protein
MSGDCLLACRGRLLSAQEYHARHWRWQAPMHGVRWALCLVLAAMVAIGWKFGPVAGLVGSLPVLPLLVGTLVWDRATAFVSTGTRCDVRLDARGLTLRRRGDGWTSRVELGELDSVQRTGSVLQLGRRGEPDLYLVVPRLHAEDLFDQLGDLVDGRCIVGETEELRGRAGF